VATFEFGPGKTFLLCSHLDVVPVQLDSQWEPVLRDGRLTGRGACDAKGSIAAMIACCERLTRDRAGLSGRLHFACVADEEANGEGIRALLSADIATDAALIGEPTDNIVVLGSRGSVRLAVHFQGLAAHASSPSRGVNAVYGGARFILAMESLQAKLEAAGAPGSCSATIVRGGSKVNIIPDECTVQVDRRLGLGETASAAVAEIETYLARVAAEVPGVSYEVASAGPWVDPFDLGSTSAFARLLLSALDQPMPGPIFRAVSDAPYLIAAGIPTAILGPGSLDTAHSSTEYVHVEALEAAAERYQRIVRAFLGASVPGRQGTAPRSWKRRGSGAPPGG